MGAIGIAARMRFASIVHGRMHGDISLRPDHRSSPKVHEGGFMFERQKNWLRRIPVDDPVDRSNAIFMQVFFILIGCAQLINKAFILARATQWALIFRSHNTLFSWPYLPVVTDLGTDVAMAVSAWVGVYLIRIGKFRESIIQYLSTLMISAIIYFTVMGIVDTRNDSSFFEALAISGLMLGRRALWVVFLAIMVVYASGILTEVIAPPNMTPVLKGAFSEFPGTVYTFIAVAIVIDRSAQALRNSLAASNADRADLKLEIKKREQAQAQLFHAKKMDIVGRLASGIAHDINNILGIVLGFARERYKTDEPGYEFGKDSKLLADALAGTEMAARRGAAICRKLLNFSRRDVTNPEVFDAATTLHELTPLLRQLLPPDIRLNMDIPTGKTPIRFDRNQFELAMLNLVSNARDAMPAGGACTVSIGRDASMVLLSVEDCGAGIPADVIEHVFEPFFTTKPANSGTGLGLSVIHDLIQSAGGHIAVDSTPGVGTRFGIHLPMADAVAEDAVSADVAVAVRVLLVDDDDDLRPLLAAALDGGGCVVSQAANAWEAEAALREMHSPPEILVCDHRMPGMDGTTFLRKLRLRLPHIPAILISAYLETDGSPPGCDDPFSERLPKPFAPDALLARVHAAARRSRGISLSANV